MKFFLVQNQKIQFPPEYKEEPTAKIISRYVLLTGDISPTGKTRDLSNDSCSHLKNLLINEKYLPAPNRSRKSPPVTSTNSIQGSNPVQVTFIRKHVW